MTDHQLVLSSLERVEVVVLLIHIGFGADTVQNASKITKEYRTKMTKVMNIFYLTFVLLKNFLRIMHGKFQNFMHRELHLREILLSMFWRLC